ncbi:hypothetical protein [Cupriavidus sp. AU9028]|uniref:hypothetical protein n=1 Tax=Cupriavidus sp. AU9028 TaxID=2871157 RepID=UPI001C93FD3B|nr:hypothetical protein [Cupriavidus sp. AU9028]MBY4896970.1 hypothetical protein [Cupriavidus sp. AU9028]
MQVCCATGGEAPVSDPSYRVTGGHVRMPPGTFFSCWRAGLAAIALLAPGVSTPLFAAAEPVADQRRQQISSNGPLPASADLERPPICLAPWFRAGARAQLEADGKMPMSITVTVHQPSFAEDSCGAWIDIHSKSALAATMGPPVVMDQVHRLSFGPGRIADGDAISSHNATINAQARYGRLFGVASFEGKGFLSYAGRDIREGMTLPGESLRSSASLQIHSLHTGEPVTTIEIPKASIEIGSRQVGKAQRIATALGPRDCLPIRFEKRTSLGTVLIGGEPEAIDPFTMSVTDWYCPSEAFVLRSEVQQGDDVQTIDTTAIGLPEGMR